MIQDLNFYDKIRRRLRYYPTKIKIQYDTMYYDGGTKRYRVVNLHEFRLNFIYKWNRLDNSDGKNGRFFDSMDEGNNSPILEIPSEWIEIVPGPNDDQEITQ